MKILITSDLHYDIARSRGPARQAAEQIIQAGGDVLVLVGDTAGADQDLMREALELFRPFPGRRLIVPGNHCLWCYGGGNSLERYEKTLPALAAEAGFVVLDHHPLRIGQVGLVGTIGWYDYSFRIEGLGMPLDFYRAKLTPAAAAYHGRGDLVARHAGALSPRLRGMGIRWMDGQYVNLGMSDEEFTRRLCSKLREQLEDLSADMERIVVFVHHLPFHQLVPQSEEDRFAFTAAYMGAAALGEVLRQFPKVERVYCGHSHFRRELRIDNMTVISIGSTYLVKRVEVLEI